MKLFSKKIIGLSLLLLLGFGFFHVLIVNADDSSSKETIIGFMLAQIREKHNNLGKYQVTMSASTKTTAGREFSSEIEKRITFDGLKKVDEQFIKASTNGKPITEEQAAQRREKINPENDHSQNFGQLEQEFSQTDQEKLYNQISLEGSDRVNGVAVYKLKFSPAVSQRVKEGYLYVDRSSFEIVKTQIVGKANERVQSARTEIQYQKCLKGYYMPVVIKSEIQAEIKRNRRTISTKTVSEIKLTDYQML